MGMTRKLMEYKEGKAIKKELDEDEMEGEEEIEESIVTKPLIKKELVNTKRPLVVMELPTKQYRTLQDSNGETFEAITLLEAVQEILERVKRIDKNVGP